MMKKLALLTTAILTAFALWFTTIAPRQITAAPEPPPGGGEVDPALEQALQDKLGAYQGKLMGASDIGYTIDNFIPSDDEQSALLWLAPVDLATGEVIATEPALALAVRDATQPDGWQVLLPNDASFGATLDAFPDRLLPIEMQIDRYAEKSGLNLALDATVYRGYKLPWAAGVKKGLSGSIGHFLIYNSCGIERCRYAYDFSDGTMFPLLAAKGGTVKYFYDGCYNGNSECTNYLVLEDRSTSPTTYQIYYHMAANSIPAELKKAGAPVLQGQFIGNADDTGYSSGHHLHFHVVTTLYTYVTAYGQTVPWGSSVDIRFDDVSINDGTPRTCNEATKFPEYGTQCQDQYISGNVGANPGTASLSLPLNGQVLTSPGLEIAGIAADDRGVVKIQAVARNRDGAWVELGSPTSANPFSISADVCSAYLNNGLIDIGVRVWDYEGNISVPQGVRSLVKNYGCTPQPPAACTPTADQVAIYSEPNYYGACRKLSVNNTAAYASGSFDPVGAGDTASIQVGANVRAVASTAAMTYILNESNQQIITSGRIESFEASDPNLADNPIGSNTIVSMVVQPKTLRVSDDDVVTFPAISTNSTAPTSFPARDSLGVSFFEPGGTSFRVQVFREVSAGSYTLYQEYDSLPLPAASLGSLPPGKYRLWACGKNYSNGTSCSNNTPFYYFVITSDGLPAQTAKATPWTDALNANTGEWSVSGLWRWGNLSEGRAGYIYNQNGSYGAGGNQYGSLTSPPIQLPASGSTTLRFHYRYETESPYRFWDQRWVQVAVDGAPFQNVVQLTDDPANYWLTSQDIDLSAYKGQKIRVRFFFFTADATANNFSGWQIDQVSISQNGLTATCSDGNANPATAAAIAINQHITGQTICPAGDVDYFKFTGNKGQQLGIWIDAIRDGSQLDPVLALLDKNGSLIYENDDQVPYVVPDSMLNVILPETATYYLKVKAWDHPGAGGANYPYTLHIFEDTTPPVISITAPGSVWPTDKAFPFTVDGSDGSTRIMQMDFFWHPADWQGGTWQLIGTDYNGADGWNVSVDPLKLGELKNSALYAEAKDAAGNVRGEIKVTSQIDTVLPTVSINPLPASMDSSAFVVTFSGSDDTALKSLELQSRKAGGAWATSGAVQTKAGQYSEWFIGSLGATYEFQAVGKDTAGNTAAAATSTVISATCTPDAFEGADGQPNTAPLLQLGAAQDHNFCANDVDWVAIDGEAGKRHFVQAFSLGGGAAFMLEVYGSDGATLLASAFSSGLGQSAALLWMPPATGKYYLKVMPIVPELAGTGVRYQLLGSNPFVYYFPVVGR